MSQPQTDETTMTEENRFPNDDPNLYVFHVTKDIGCKEAPYNPSQPMTKREFFESLGKILMAQVGVLKYVSYREFIEDLQRDGESKYLPLLGYSYAAAAGRIEESRLGLFLYTVHPMCDWKFQCSKTLRDSDDTCFEFIRTILQLRGGDCRYELPGGSPSPPPVPVPPLAE